MEFQKMQTISSSHEGRVGFVSLTAVKALSFPLWVKIEQWIGKATRELAHRMILCVGHLVLNR